MKTIFLDIDDVVNSNRLLASGPAADREICPPAVIPLRGDPIALALVNRASEICGANVVVSSSWVYALGWSFTRGWLLDSGLEGRLLHDDPHVPYGPWGDKGVAIVDWLERHPDVVPDRACVVDDDSYLFSDNHILARRQVIVDGQDGLLLRHFLQIIEMLGPEGAAK